MILFCKVLMNASSLSEMKRTGVVCWVGGGWKYLKVAFLIEKEKGISSLLAVQILTQAASGTHAVNAPQRRRERDQIYCYARRFDQIADTRLTVTVTHLCKTYLSLLAQARRTGETKRWATMACPHSSLP